MTHQVVRSAWQKVKFGDVVVKVAESGLPTPYESRLYVGLDHMPTDGSVTIRSWGSDVDIAVPKTRVREGDVLFARRNTSLRRAAVAPHDGYFSPDGYAFRANEERLHQRFLIWVVASSAFMENAVQRSAGTHSKRVRWEDLARFEFLLPPLDEQERIADLLWSLETHRETCAALLQAVGSTIEARLAGMADGPLGQPVTLAEIATWTSGATPRAGTPEFYQGGHVPWAVIADLNNEPLVDTATHLTQAGLAAAGSLVQPGATLVSMYGTVGRVALTLSPMATNQAIACGTPDTSKVRPEYLFWLMQSLAPQLRGAARGGTQLNINREIIKTTRVYLPSLQDQDAVIERIQEAVAAKQQVESELEHLGRVHTGLLQVFV